MCPLRRLIGRTVTSEPMGKPISRGAVLNRRHCLSADYPPDRPIPRRLQTYSTLSSIEISDVSNNSNPPASASPRRNFAQLIISGVASSGWLRSLQRRCVRAASSQCTNTMRASAIPAVANPSVMNAKRIWPSNSIGRASRSLAIRSNHSIVIARCHPPPGPDPAPHLATRSSGDGTPMLSNRNTRTCSECCCSILSAIVVLPEPDAPVRMTSPIVATAYVSFKIRGRQYCD